METTSLGLSRSSDDLRSTLGNKATAHIPLILIDYGGRGWFRLVAVATPFPPSTQIRRSDTSTSLEISNEAQGDMSEI